MPKERDWGYSIGGPVGKPGGNNKLFFFYSQEFAPRTGGNDVMRFRMPTALERQGDFSQTTDNNGNPYPYIKDPRLTGACTATNQAALLRRRRRARAGFPANRLYQTGPEHPEACVRCRTSPMPAGPGLQLPSSRGRPRAS